MPHAMDPESAAIRIVLPDGTIVERYTDIVTAIKILDLLTKPSTQKNVDTISIPTKVVSSVPSIEPITTPTTKQQITQKYEIPSREWLLKYIRSQPDYLHSIEGIIIDFAGQEILNQKEEVDRLRNSIRHKLQRIREGIEKEENGHWEEDRVGLSKHFRFVKSININANEKANTAQVFQRNLGSQESE